MQTTDVETPCVIAGMGWSTRLEKSSGVISSFWARSAVGPGGGFLLQALSIAHESALDRIQPWK